MRYLVTGGTGFVGAHVVHDLHREGHEVTVLDIAPDRGLLSDVLGGAVPSTIQVVSGDVTDLAQLVRVMKSAGTQRVVHLAALLGAPSRANPLRAIRVNVEGTVNVFEAALAVDAERVVWASTNGVFGAPSNGGPPLSNDAPHTPISVYGATKSLAEFLGGHYRRERGLDNVALRFTTVYGFGKARSLPRGSGTGFLQELLDKPAVGEAGTLTNGNDVQTWLYVEDAALAVRLAMDAPPSPVPALMVCGDTRTMSDAVVCVRRLLPGADLRVTSEGTPNGYYYDCSVTEAAIGYRPRFTMEEGFRATINALRAHRGLPAVS
jgi:UDP-glucose 4-epimerase